MCHFSRLLLIASFFVFALGNAARSEQQAPTAPPGGSGETQAVKKSAPARPGRRKPAADEPDEHHLPEGHTPLAPISKDLFFRYTGRGYHNRLIRYRLFVPDGLMPQKKYPMIVWLHGLRDGGRDNAKQLNHLDQCVFEKPWTKGRFPFFFLAVQCPPGNPLWVTTSTDADDMINVVVAAIDKTVREYPIDPSRISLAGISSGGSGVWEFAMRFPERFSAIAPMASSGGDLARAKRLAALPIWAFHSAREWGAPIGADRQMVAAVKAAGGRICLTEINTDTHDCWTAAFHDYDLLDWLLYQRRGQVSDYPPGTIPLASRWRHFRDTTLSFVNPASWRPWQIAVQIGVPIVLLIACISAKRKIWNRARARKSAQATTSGQ